MTEETKGGSPGEAKASFSELLAKTKGRAEAMLADFMAQDPETIDIAGRVPHLPGMVLDALVEMKDQLNETSRAAIDEWQETERQRARERWALLEQSHAQFVSSLPPNWQSPEVDFPDLNELEVLQLKEGLPLAWVPRSSQATRTRSSTLVSRNYAGWSPTKPQSGARPHVRLFWP